MTPDDGPQRTLAEIIDQEVRRYRAWGTSAGDFIAGNLEVLAKTVRWTGANSTEELVARIGDLSDQVRRHREGNE